MKFVVSKSVEFTLSDFEECFRPEVVEELKERLGVRSFESLLVLECNNKVEFFTHKA